METTATTKRNKHLILTQKKIEKAKSILGASTETETIEIALERIIDDAETDRKLRLAHARFVKNLTGGNADIRDVFGNLE
jgi:hypothetical protein